MRNGSYVIPVRANGKFLPVLTILTENGTKANVQRLVPHVKTEVTKRTEPQKQVILVPVLIDARMFQAVLSHSRGFGSVVDERPRDVQDVIFCFTARGTQMCVRTDLFARRVTALARRLKERGKKRRKLRLRKKGRRHRKMFRSSKLTDGPEPKRIVPGQIEHHGNDIMQSLLATTREKNFA